MLFIFVNVIYVLSALAMIVLILLQRGAGAAAGSGFGGGASATVFGARGSSNFLSKATKWLAVVVMSISLGLAIYGKQQATRGVTKSEIQTTDLGVMANAPAAAPALPSGATPTVPSATVPSPAPAIPSPVVPTVPEATPAPTGVAPTVPQPQPVAPAPGADNGAKQGDKPA